MTQNIKILKRYKVKTKYINNNNNGTIIFKEIFVLFFYQLT